MKRMPGFEVCRGNGKELEGSIAGPSVALNVNFCLLSGALAPLKGKFSLLWVKVLLL